MKPAIYLISRVVLALMLIVAITMIHISATSSNFTVLSYHNDSDIIEGYIEVKNDVRTKYMYMTLPSHYIFTVGSNRTWVRDSDIEDNEEVYVYDVQYDLNEGI